MQKSDVKQVVQKAVNGGKRFIQIAFKDNDFDAPAALLGFERVGSIVLDEKQRSRLNAAVQSGRWKRGDNRSVNILLTKNFKADSFLDWIGDALDDAKVL